ncbi:MAG TPA: UMP kinase [Candidatus Saccharimonadales bacterium]
MYKRILLKLSGEQLQGDQTGGFDVKRAAWIAEEVKKAMRDDAQVVIMVGGGNFVRGASVVGGGIAEVTAHNMGMLGTLINAVALADVFEFNGLPARALTNVISDQVADQFTHRRAISHLQKRRVVIVGGGIGRPYLTTDTAAVNLALELDCDVILKATKVDGVYTKDPVKYPDAKKIASLTFQEAVENENIKVMDKAALGLAMEQKQPLIIFDLLMPGNIAKAVRGDVVGTTIS